MFHSNLKTNRLREDKRKVMMETLFEKLKTSEDRALLLMLIQSYKDEVWELTND